MPDHASVLFHPGFRVGAVDRRLFGTLVEHMGRAVYTGIFEPDHPTSDEHGFRGDVAALASELGITTARYPGGNFVSSYVWEDGVGPDRPRVLDLGWRTVETNTVGTDEFLQWAERHGIEPMMAVNLGTRGVEAAAALVEYCNGAAGTRWADLRVANGRVEPYGVRLWCLGNELDGPWQVGHKDADEYGRLAAEAGKAMKRVDPSIELIACGSSSMEMPTFGDWEQTVLEHAWDVVDHVSMHAYYQEHDGDRASFLASGTAMDRFIRRVAASADAVAARKGSDRRLTISFDEWNVWYLSRFPGADNLPVQDGAPRIIEDVYSALDAVVVGDLLVTLLNHADRVPLACLAQLVNVIAPIMTEPGGPAWRQPTFHPFAATARLARGTVLDARVTCGTMPTERHGAVPLVTAAVVADDEATAIFLVNRSTDAVEVDLLHPGSALALTGGIRVTADTVAAEPGPAHAAATAERHVAQLELDGVLHDDRSTVLLPPESWTAFTGTAERRAR
ncbi:arabinosylfuranosidase ArfA [Cellulomonas edaphi]|uniref:non-reducing end alpha-L-arabinofuranosidase n=1 Tax=Cellulomonas edaphi TaxID=3053468 RepID=A0ABT7S4R2_9CELL|nr:alpha-L-arabinofuranosidase C-terminal domain-containing protein [Cellulomons edaphi]MDM7830613.1 alpha-L-arabinofuranosidase C-terminal domain-containing protein [Cellulomons edaphi]